METLRLGTFETNSSSCHAFVLMASALYGDEKGWPKYLIAKWTKHGSEYDAGLGIIVAGEEAAETIWKDFKDSATVLTRKDMSEIVPLLCEGKSTDDKELRARYPKVDDIEWSTLEDVFYSNMVESEELVGGSCVMYGDTVGIAYEKEC